MKAYLRFIWVVYVIGSVSRFGFAQGVPVVAAQQTDGGAPWTTVQTAKVGSQVVTRRLERPYPDFGVPGTDKAIKPVVTTSAQAQLIADNFLTQYSQQMVTPLDASAPHTNILVFKKVIAIEHVGELLSRGTDFSVKYSQQHKGIPVYNTEMTVHVMKNGEICFVINQLEAVNADVPTEPRLTAGDALARARQELNDLAAIPDGEAVLYILPPSQLAWWIQFLRPHSQKMLIDAITGEVLWRRSNIRR